MFRILDRKRKVIGLLQSPIEPRIEEAINGMYELYFSVPSSYQGLELEGYIQIENEHEYVIKEIVTHGTNREVVAIMNVEELFGNSWVTFRSVDTNVYDCMREILSGTNWRAVNQSTRETTRSLLGSNTTSWDLISQFCSIYDVEVKFDTYKKEVTIVDRLGGDLGVYFINELNLKQLNHDSHTHKYITQVIPIGKNGMTIEDINDGKLYVSDYTYTDKKITGIWKADSYNDKQALKEDAQKFLAEMAVPYQTYECLVVDLNKAQGANNFAYGIGDIITLIDNTTNQRVKQRIIKQTRYLIDPSSNSIQIANKNMTFQDYYKRLQMIASMTEQILNGDGTISTDKVEVGDVDFVLKADSILAEHIKSNQIFARHIVADNISAEHIKSESIDTRHLKANIINAGHIQSGSITAGSGIIAEGAIGDAEISNINANKINAGEIDTSKVKVTGEDGFLFIENNTLYVVDNNRQIRVELGSIQDATNFGFIVRGADGQTILIDHTGVKNAGLTDGAVDNRTVSENANISGKKLDINSVIRRINEDGSVKITGTVVQVGETTLDIKMSEQTNKITEQGKKLETQQAQISSNTEAIKLKVDNQTYQTDKQNINSKLDKHTSEIEVLQEEIALKVGQTEIDKVKDEISGTVDSKIEEAKSEIKVTTDSISQSVSQVTNKAEELEGKVTDHESRIETAEQKITPEAITTTVSQNFYTKGDIDDKGYQTKAEVEHTANEVQFRFEESGGYNRLINSAFKNGTTPWTILNWNNLGNNPNATCRMFVNQQGQGDWLLPNRNILVAEANGLTTNTSERLGVGFDYPSIWGGTEWTFSCMIGWHRASSVSIEILEFSPTGERYPEFNSYLLQGSQYFGGNQRENWYHFNETFTFKNEGVANFTIRIFLNEWNGELDSAVLFMAEPMLTLGNKLGLPYTPNADELYAGITTIDKDGVKVNHNSGSFSQLNSKEFYQANEKGDRTISMRYGGLRLYQFPSSGNQEARAYLGGISTSNATNNKGLYGTSIFGTQHSGYISLGFSEESQDTQAMEILPWLELIHYDGNKGKSSGVYTYKPLYVKHYSYFYVRPYFHYGISFPYEDSSKNSEVSFLAMQDLDNSNNGNRNLMVCGADGVRLMIKYNGNKIAHQMLETSNSPNVFHQAWGNWDFNGWTIYNANITRKLNDPSQPVTSKARLFTRDSQPIMSTRNLLEERGEDTTSNGFCLIEIPNDIKYNIGKYDVSIIKYGKGDIWVSKRTPDYFIVESENDISFTWILQGELLENFGRPLTTYDETVWSKDTGVSNGCEEDTPTYRGGSRFTTCDDEQIVEILSKDKELLV